jgi:triosephosphate isomerase (TIM)
MRKPLIAGNWKMHGSKDFVADLLSQLVEHAAKLDFVELAVCPPFVFLEQVSQMLAGTTISFGAQNVYQADAGAYTGEISPPMLLEFGCQYVIVGHSERRTLMGEGNAQVAEKFFCASAAGLKPILCVGETQEQKEHKKTFDVIASMLTPIFNTDNLSFLHEAVIAYEPVWAIGTGLTATPLEAQDVHEFIRQEVRKVDKLLAEKLRILYGGSVKQHNASSLFAMPDIDGGLIGGASLNAKEFLEIARSCNYL